MTHAELQTQRLLLRPFVMQDVRDLFAIRHDDAVMQYWDWPLDVTEEHTAQAARAMLDAMRASAALYWSVRLRTSGQWIGVVDLSELGVAGSADIGFMFARAHWGQGYAREAMACIIDVAADLGMQLLTARIHAGNERSARLLGALGFSEARPAQAVEVRSGVSILCRWFALQLAAPARE